jgi:type IV pilus assembly protein PilW
MIKKQHGVTMIELLIAMVLGLGLVAGIGELFVQSQKSFRLQRNLSDMTDDGAFLLEAFAKSALRGGYKPLGAQKNFLPASNNVFSVTGSPSVPDIKFLDNDEFIRGLDDDAKGDQLVYRYKAQDSSELEDSICTNFDELKAKRTDLNDTITVRFYKRYDYDLDTFFVYCKAGVNNEHATAQPLVSDVEKLIFQYGVHDTNGYYYADATDITDWKKVFAVKITIVLKSVDDNLVKNPSYKIDNVTVAPAPVDHRLYKVFSKTVYLRAPPQ